MPPDSPLKVIEQQLAETSEISNEFISTKIKKLGLRFLLVSVLLLWNLISWVKWTLLLSVPMALYALWQILSTKFRLNKKVAEIQETIDHIEAMESK